ncbi:orotidine-5'-phosphate decarboxylase [Pantoea sp. Aalb]|uniref:orotidine-5'-phosphate decarboxylase n=1 Tax=Pantoea sp. Aalb TaxID=2576762 RepID=UPI0013274430|nr:orotidine-5'-phosphate decarboxylase [Pantoea sp. Aalb]
MITSPIIIALDFNNINNIMEFVDKIDPKQCGLKIGKETFTLFGPSLIKILQDRKFKVFLDLKFHDIPHTTACAVSAAADLGVWIVNVHAYGGERMMNAARESLIPFGKNAPLLIAVTVLTSINQKDLNELGINLTPAQQGEKLARLASKCGLDGVICSAQEAALLKKVNQNFIIVTPGIRLIVNNNDDQHRIMTPIEAHQVGVDYMVIGRPITRALNPYATLQYILKSLLKENKY